MTRWKLTDAYEMGYEYECPDCKRHIGTKFKDKDLPDECPYCGSKMTEATIEDAIKRLETCDECGDCLTCAEHDEAVQMAIAALREQEERSKGCEHCRSEINRGLMLAHGYSCCTDCGRRLEEV